MVYYGQRCFILLFLLTNKSLSGEGRSECNRLPFSRYADSIQYFLTNRESLVMWRGSFCLCGVLKNRRKIKRPTF